MKNEYAFSGAARGKFYREGARLRLPIHLEPDVQTKLAEAAAASGVTLDELVNRLLKNEIELMDRVA